MSEQSKTPEKTIGAQAATAARRKDPVRRHADGAANVASVRNPDPRRKYVLVSMSDNDAMGTYEENGFVREYLTADGVRLFGQKSVKPGELITYRGHVLMSIETEKAEEIRRRGAPGMGEGTMAWDRIEKKLVDRRAGSSDLLRGIGGNRHMHVENDSELITEFGNL